MKELIIKGSQIVVGKDIDNLYQYLPDKRVFVITDRTVYGCHNRYFSGLKEIIIEEGEEHKTLESVGFITERLIEEGADRDSFLLGFGGGVVSDITGFVASIYMRGCDFGFVSTTLLSQVDAGVGGKNGVNFHGYKNMLGLFNQPQFVLCDPTLLSPLPEKLYLAGFAEIVKSAVIANPELFNYLEAHISEALQRREDVLQHLIYETIKIKAEIVEHDEKERGERRKLNLGHTFAHAIEREIGLSHGEAVSVGLCIASNLAEQEGLISLSESRRIRNLLAALKLPISVDVDIKKFLPTIFKDKKRSGEYINFVLPLDIGKCMVKRITFDDFSKMI